MNLFILLISLLVINVDSAKILAIFPAPGYSQFILGEVLLTELARRGHEVTVISPHKPKIEPKNYKTILTDEVLRIMDGFDLIATGGSDLHTNIYLSYLLGDQVTYMTLKNEKVQQLLHSNEKFDLVIMEAFFNCAMHAFAVHFQAPLITISTMGLSEWNRETIGVPSLPTLNPIIYADFSNEMSFCERVTNIFGTVYDYLYRHYVHYPKQRQHLKEFFPKPIDFDTMVNNASVMFINAHPTTAQSTLLPYNVIEIGGAHVVKGTLDKTTQDFLDKATEGVILFSLGSNLRSSELTQEMQDYLFKILGSVKEKVLWKFEKDVPNKPKNIFISKWLNQKDILAHPNVKLFITHGGMLGTTEAVVHGVPMLGIPVFADQRMNMARAKANGIAEFIIFPDLTEELLSSTLNKMLADPSYKLQSKILSDIIQDRPQKPLDLAIYWTEHVIRHKGFRFDLPTRNMYWFQVYMLDILSIVVLIVIVSYLILRKIVNALCWCQVKKDVTKKSNKKVN